jgi:hypothetical protein
MTPPKKRRNHPNAKKCEPDMTEPSSIPNGRFLIESIGLSQDRLDASIKTKVGVPTQLLKELLRIMASTLPFDLDFYLSTYPDVREAHDAGQIADPRTHFIEQGYIEGRLGSKPNIDEDYYRNAYPDVKAAIDAGELKSALEHYSRAGVFEARFPNSESVANIKRWLAILGR